MASVGFIGSKDLTAKESVFVRSFVTDLIQEQFLSEDAQYDYVYFSNGNGVPTIVGDICQSYRINYEIVPVTLYQWEGPGGFKQTNTAIIDRSDLVVVLCTTDGNNAGILWSERCARKANKLCRMVWINAEGDPKVDLLAV